MEKTFTLNGEEITIDVVNNNEIDYEPDLEKTIDLTRVVEVYHENRSNE